MKLYHPQAFTFKMPFLMIIIRCHPDPPVLRVAILDRACSSSQRSKCVAMIVFSAPQGGFQSRVVSELHSRVINIPIYISSYHFSSLEKTMMLGKFEGKSRRGQQSTRWLDSVIKATNMNLIQLWEAVEDRRAWRVLAHGVMKSHT